MRRVALAAVLLVVAVTLARPACAAENGEWGVNPSGHPGGGERTFFSYEVRPGQHLTDSVTLTNYSAEPITLQLASVDAYNTANDGAFALRSPDDGEPTDVGAWIRLPVDRWTIPPKSQTVIDFELAVPSDARPGDHAGGILSLAAAEPAARETGVTVRKGVGVRLYARVIGDARSAVTVDQLHTSYGTPLTPFSSSDATLSFRITNNGDRLATPAIRIEASGLLGDAHEADLGTTQELLPGNSVVLTHHWSGVPAGGPVTQRVIVNGTGFDVTRSTTFWVVPWWLLALVLAGAGLFWLRRRVPRRAATAVASAALMLVLIAAPAVAAEQPRVTLGSDQIAIGETMRASGRGWEPRSNVVVELCGNLARDGSVDCDLAGSRVVSVGPDGRFAAAFVVGDMPSPCPCVVRARALTADAQVVTAVDIAGVDTEPIDSPPPRTRQPARAPEPGASSPGAQGQNRPVALGVATGSLVVGAVCALRFRRQRRASASRT